MRPASFADSPHSACVRGSTAEYATNQVAARTRLVHSAASHAPEPGRNVLRRVSCFRMPPAENLIKMRDIDCARMRIRLPTVHARQIWLHAQKLDEEA